MAALVIDASFALALLLPDEAKPPAAAVAQLEAHGAIVPSIWHFEVANTLVMAERRQRIAAPDVGSILTKLARLPIATDDKPAASASVDCAVLAMRRRLTVYDAAYLELAKRLRLPLATLDGDLRKAAKAEGVTA